MPALPNLCDSCSKLLQPFSGDHDPELVQERHVDEILLGTLPQIRSRECRLCNLVCEAIDKYRKAEPCRRPDSRRLMFESPEKDSISLKLHFKSDFTVRFPFEIIKNDKGNLRSRSRLDGLALAFGSPYFPSHISQFAISTGMVTVDLLRMRVGTVLDFEAVSRWLEYCDTSHGEHSKCRLPVNGSVASLFPGLEVLRLIDVIDGCIVEVHDHVPDYLALSYVWGTVSNFRLTRANRSRLQLPGAMSRLWTALPMTIRDAITLTQRLGMRYLWADSLCLMQNDGQDLERGVGVMDHIYERAWLTVIAACGHDANAGLPGIRAGSRPEQTLDCEVCPDTFVGTYISPEHLLLTSVYNTRAWTYQESLLSRRKLYFVDDKVFFKCGRSEIGEMIEDGLDSPDLFIRDTRTMHDNFMMIDSQLKIYDDGSINLLHYRNYTRNLSGYTSRTLGNQEDALRAMAGIMRRNSEMMKSSLLQGLPVKAMEPFMSFSGRNLRRRRGFPSYSWAGWIGAVDILIDPSFNSVLCDLVWIVWHKIEPGSFGAVRVWEDHEDPILMEFNNQFRENGRLISSSLFAGPGRPMPLTEPTIAYSGPALGYPLLQFWTMSVFFKVTDVEVFNYSAELSGSDGSLCGRILLDGYEETTLFEDNESFELILISRSSCLMPKDIVGGYHGQSGLPLGSESGSAAPFPAGVRDPKISSKDYYRVMVIEWTQFGVAERRGIGGIKKEAIQKSLAPGPVWKEIILG